MREVSMRETMIVATIGQGGAPLSRAIAMNLDPKFCACNSPKRLWRRLATVASIGLVALSSSSRAAPKEPHLDVDLELVIAVDVSSSMNDAEQRVQREGYASALRSSDVLEAIKSGPRGRVAITYFEWASPNYQRILMPWTVIDGPDDAAAFADEIEAQTTVSEGGTSISAGLLLATKLLETKAIESDRQTIDVSGDGPNNAGPPIKPVRDALIARGVTINGLAISLPAHDAPHRLDYFGPHYVESYCEGCVIGGPDAFVIAVGEVAEFKKSIRRKMLNEIAGLPVRLQRATYDAGYPPVTDCRSLSESPGR
jgi:Protein of unknown function (DUF1194)